MAYTALATSRTPSLVIYVLDVSASMEEILGNRRRIDVVMDALGASLRQMVFRSTKGIRVAPRYRIAMLAYSEHVYDLLDGIKTVEQIAQLGIPELSTMGWTDTARAFAQVERLLASELPKLGDCPAPLVCHLTDGEYTGDDPAPIVQRIMRMAVPDGNVLVENIFISDTILAEPLPAPEQWQGVLPATRLTNAYAEKLRDISSPLPGSYREVMAEAGYQLADGARMLLPGTSPEMVEMGFVMSAATGVQPR